MEIITSLINFIVHIDTHLTELVNHYGVLTYIILFLIIFAETGFVVTPFLPGDSLLFATGAIAAIGSLNIVPILLILIFAAILGDTVNYWIGHFFGKKIIDSPKIPFINHEHIEKTEKFYKKHGGKTIIIARFMPIIRTFAPFVAGVGAMDYGQFIKYNAIGGIVWISLFTFAGYFFGNLPFIKNNFHYTVFIIIFLSIIPIIYEFIQHKRKAKISPPKTKVKK